MHREMGAHQRVLIVELGAGEEVQARRIDEYRGAIGRDDEILVILGAGQVEFILKTAAAAGQHLDSQCLRIRVARQYLGNPAGGGLGEAEGGGGGQGFTHATHIARTEVGLKARMRVCQPS